jgi:hypothetical protein
MNELAARVRALVANLVISSDAAVASETIDWCRVDQVSCATADLLEEIKGIATALTAADLGTTSIYGEVEGDIDLPTATLERVRDDSISIIFNKPHTADWALHYTERGFAADLAPSLTRKVVWVAADFDEFMTFSTLVCGWGGARDVEIPNSELESPRKLVRDRTHGHAPSEIGPWLLARKPLRSSSVFEEWRQQAIQQLSFCLPFEIKTENEQLDVVLKGPRSTLISVIFDLAAHEDDVFEALNDAALWAYSGRRDAESKFTFLNYHLSLDWREGETWPLGAQSILPGSLASARDAFAFHLQDESRDALRSLADLRRALQDEVGKVQQASRDLISALWRDFAIAGGVIALRYVPGMTSIPPDWLRVITLTSAFLLLVSLAVSLWSNARYHRLARKSRDDWRSRLYAFVDEAEWARLVNQPIKSGLRTYLLVSITTSLFYAAIILYLFYIADGWTLISKLAVSY